MREKREISQINFPAVRALRFHHAKEPRETERKANDAQQNSGESKIVLHYANLFNCSDDVIPFLRIIYVRIKFKKKNKIK